MGHLYGDFYLWKKKCIEPHLYRTDLDKGLKLRMLKVGVAPNPDEIVCRAQRHQMRLASDSTHWKESQITPWINCPMQIQLFTTLCTAASFLVGQNREIGSFKTFDLNLVAGLKAKGGVDWMSRTSSWKKLKNDFF